jgi:quinol monooxygenase YgiN
MPSSSRLGILAITTAAPGKQDALRAAQEKLVAETLKEPGCIHYELRQSLEDPRVLIFVETWESEELWRAHMSGDAMRRFQASGAGELIQDFILHRLVPVAGGRRIAPSSPGLI